MPSTKNTNESDDDKDDFDSLCTWKKLKSLSSQIQEYSSVAGDKDADNSYYVIMLNACKKYHDDDSTQKDKDDAKQTIMDATSELLEDMAPMQTYLSKIQTALGDFDNSCQANQASLETLEQTMSATLEDQFGDIKDLLKDIDKLRGDVDADQHVIDKDRMNEELTAAYVWIPVAGTIAGVVMWTKYQNEINAYQDKIDNLEAQIESDEAKVKAHISLMGIVTSMKISSLIGPAKTTIEEIQGGWDVMGNMLQDLYDNAAKFEDKIPTMTIDCAKLNTISQEWRDLYVYVNTYVSQADLTPDLKVKSLDDYKKELHEASSKQRS
ncbi:uncharacterized protein BO66DRAFT_398237 [Aspergillus aculeatinus CBS 121060]|uniref:Uncharacterized protein n=1 Tax=Aspergillus aculeatinus CBS 121060 TaxID=1448322 RepID=A0ACD1HIZ2_9EURO|nr:hypothetical protein BO66DRAFT_398237 [Aspergillus aculeatinus CBS 121060]RAH73824.1 hypothetical protein BO66DRAFT_398237 [Aspergillus aculeatinus CBS 121060]